MQQVGKHVISALKHCRETVKFHVESFHCSPVLLLHPISTILWHDICLSLLSSAIYINLHIHPLNSRKLIQKQSRLVFQCVKLMWRKILCASSKEASIGLLLSVLIACLITFIRCGMKMGFVFFYVFYELVSGFLNWMLILYLEIIGPYPEGSKDFLKYSRIILTML